jgi:hypothetical protein
LDSYASASALADEILASCRGARCGGHDLTRGRTLGRVDAGGDVPRRSRHPRSPVSRSQTGHGSRVNPLPPKPHTESN